MAKKKTEETPEYLWKDELAKLEISNMLKKGVAYYIETNNKIPKDSKELDKVIDDYKKLTIGE